MSGVAGSPPPQQIIYLYYNFFLEIKGMTGRTGRTLFKELYISNYVSFMVIKLIENRRK